MKLREKALLMAGDLEFEFWRYIELDILSRAAHSGKMHLFAFFVLYRPPAHCPRWMTVIFQNFNSNCATYWLLSLKDLLYPYWCICWNQLKQVLELGNSEMSLSTSGSILYLYWFLQVKRVHIATLERLPHSEIPLPHPSWWRNLISLRSRMEQLVHLEISRMLIASQPVSPREKRAYFIWLPHHQAAFDDF